MIMKENPITRPAVELVLMLLQLLPTVELEHIHNSVELTRSHSSSGFVVVFPPILPTTHPQPHTPYTLTHTPYTLTHTTLSVEQKQGRQRKNILNLNTHNTHT